MQQQINVVGIAQDGCLSLTSRAVNAVVQADIVAGATRHLEWFPQFQGEFIELNSGVSAMLAEIKAAYAEGFKITILASGDPLFFGIGTLLLKHFKAQHLNFLPTNSCAQLACARLKISWQNAQFISVHGRELFGLTAKMQTGDLFAILTDNINTPVKIARHLQSFNQTNWQMHVAENLGGVDEKLSSWSVNQLAASATQFASLNVIIIKRSADNFWGGNGLFAPDTSFACRNTKRGLITKAAVRNLAITSMGITANSCIWDIGAGSGSVGITAAKIATRGLVYLVESNSQCYGAIDENMRKHATDNVVLVPEMAPQALIELPAPDGVFIGGSRGNMLSILDYVWEQLVTGGVVTCTSITFETFNLITKWLSENKINYQVQLINISHGHKLGSYQAYRADNPIHLFTFKKQINDNKKIR